MILVYQQILQFTRPQAWEFELYPLPPKSIYPEALKVYNLYNNIQNNFSRGPPFCWASKTSSLPVHNPEVVILV